MMMEKVAALFDPWTPLLLYTVLRTVNQPKIQRSVRWRELRRGKLLGFWGLGRMGRSFDWAGLFFSKIFKFYFSFDICGEIVF